jgi:heptosyltransferase II
MRLNNLKSHRINRLLFFLMDELFRCFPIRILCKNYSGKPKSIVLIFPHGIGNMILFTPVLENIKKKHPKSKLILILAPRNTIDVINDSGLIDEMIVYDYLSDPNETELLRISEKLQTFRIDLGLNFSTNSYAARLLSLSKIKYRVGFYYRFNNIREVGLLFHKAIRFDYNKHEVLNYLKIIESIGIGIKINSIQPKFFLDNKQTKKVVFKVESLGINLQKQIVGFHTGSFPDLIKKRWPARNFAKLADLLIKKCDVQIIIVGGKEEHNDIENILNMMDEKATNLSGILDLKETACLISLMNLFISNDSGPMHIAAGVGTPVLGIFGPTDERKNAPWPHGNVAAKVIRKEMKCSPCYLPYSGNITCDDNKCLTNIAPEDVYKEAQNLLICDN